MYFSACAGRKKMLQTLKKILTSFCVDGSLKKKVIFKKQKLIKAFKSKAPSFPSTQQLCGDRVGGVGPLQCHLWGWHKKTRAHGEDASYRWIHV